jgi:hypothetical protein
VAINNKPYNEEIITFKPESYISMGKVNLKSTYVKA